MWGASVYVVEPEYRWFSDDFSVCSSPIGTNPNFFWQTSKGDHSEPFLFFDFLVGPLLHA